MTLTIIKPPEVKRPDCKYLCKIRNAQASIDGLQEFRGCELFDMCLTDLVVTGIPSCQTCTMYCMVKP